MGNIQISIIIATRNRQRVLWESVEKACDAIDNTKVEIIVVNDGDLALRIPEKLAGKVLCFDNEKKGVSSARNFGASKARGEILFFVDDDMWVNSEAVCWINNYLLAAKNTGAVYFINWEYPPYMKNTLARSKIGRYLLAANYYTLWGRLHKNTSQPTSGLYQYDSVGSGSLVMHSQIFEAAGGYNEKMIFQGEDADLAGRLNKAAIPIYIVFDVTLYHNHADRLQINNFLKRTYDGFGSEFKAAKSGVRCPIAAVTYDGWKKTLFEISRITEKAWLLVYDLLPNHSMANPINNRLIGALGGLQRYKQWKNFIADR